MAEKKKNTTNSKNTAAKSTALQKSGKSGSAKKAANARKTNSAPTPVEEKKERRIMTGTVGLCITLAVAVLFVLMLFVDDMAVVGSILRPFVIGLVGIWGMVLVPLYLINLLRTWFKDRKRDKVAAKWCFSAINFLFFLMIFHRLSANNDTLLTLKGDMYAAAGENHGAGVFGGYLYAAIAALMGKVATDILCWCAFIVTLPLLFDSTIVKTVKAIVKGIRTVTVQVSEDDVEDEEELGAVVEPSGYKHTGRSGVELRDPPKKNSKTSEAKKKKSLLIGDDDLPSGDIPTIPKQIEEEINRTRGESEKAAEAETGADIGGSGTVTTPVMGSIHEYGGKDFDAEDEVDEPYTVTEPHSTVSTAVAADKVRDEVYVEPADVSGGEGEGAKTASKGEAAEDGDLVAEVPNPFEIVSDPVAEDKPYIFPPLTLLTPKESGGRGMSAEESKRTSELLIETLANFGVGAKLINTSHGPTVTRFELQPDVGVRVRKISNLSDDIALHLAATSVRIEAPIPGKSAVGIEIPNKTTSLVRLRELLEDYSYKSAKSNLLCCLGMDVVGNPVHLDIAKMPHLLIAGATGMGKSVCINSLIVSLLCRAKPDEVKLILIDPKKVEFTDYNGIPHLLVPVVTEPKKAAGSLSWAVLEMERRFSAIQEVGARNLEEYNEFTADDPEKEYIPQVVIVIDELADLMMTAPSEVENSICRLAQKARAAGMYLIIGTQRPSVDVITGLIKANIPSRIACKVASQIDSRTILDIAGAEKLLGKGDMLYNPVGATKPLRVQGAFVEGREVIAICSYLKQAAEAQYSEDVMQLIEKEAQLCGEKGSKRGSAETEGEESGGIDEMEIKALEVGIECESISTSLLQRRLSIGYARAARIIDKLEQKGMVSPYDTTAKKRTVTMSREGLAQLKMNSIDSGAASGE